MVRHDGFYCSIFHLIFQTIAQLLLIHAFDEKYLKRTHSIVRSSHRHSATRRRDRCQQN